jgi:hypothetical protein
VREVSALCLGEDEFRELERKRACIPETGDVQRGRGGRSIGPGNVDGAYQPEAPCCRGAWYIRLSTLLVENIGELQPTRCRVRVRVKRCPSTCRNTPSRDRAARISSHQLAASGN